MNISKKNIFVSSLLISLIILARLLPHLPNIAPVAAAALVAGVYLGRKWALFVPVIGMLLADLFIGFYTPVVMLSVYGSFVLIGLMSWILRRHKTLLNIISASLASSLLFFIVTNFAVWLAGDWYGHDLRGLLAAYEMAIPFFRNTLLGDLLYTSVLFAVFELFFSFSSHKLLEKRNITEIS